MSSLEEFYLEGQVEELEKELAGKIATYIISQYCLNEAVKQRDAARKWSKLWERLAKRWFISAFSTKGYDLVLYKSACRERRAYRERAERAEARLKDLGGSNE